MSFSFKRSDFALLLNGISFFLILTFFQRRGEYTYICIYIHANQSSREMRRTIPGRCVHSHIASGISTIKTNCKQGEGIYVHLNCTTWYLARK